MAWKYRIPSIRDHAAIGPAYVFHLRNADVIYGHHLLYSTEGAFSDTVQESGSIELGPLGFINDMVSASVDNTLLNGSISDLENGGVG